MADFKIKDKETGEVFTIREKGDGPVKEGLKNARNILKEGFQRSFEEGPTSVRNIAGGGFGQVLAENVKRTVLQKSGNPTFSDVQITSPMQTLMDLLGNSRGELMAQATDPMNIVGSKLPVTPSLFDRPGALRQASGKAMAQAEKLTTQILQPTVKELSNSVANGKQLPSIRRGAENIAAAGTFNEVVEHLKTTTRDLFNERNQILSDNDLPVGKQVLNELINLTSQMEKDRVLSPSKIKKMDEVLSREAQFLDENPNMTVTQAQARKEKLQELTKPLLEKRQSGTLTGFENVELQAYDALRYGYRQSILRSLPKDKASIVDKINSKYEGLLDATELASKQAARSDLQVPKTLIDKVAASFGLSPQFTAFRLATKEAAGVLGKTRLNRTTSKIAELRNKSETLRQLAHLARKASR